MTVTRDCTVYCGICGGPIFEEGQEDDYRWLSTTVLLHATKDQEGMFDLLEMPAKSEGGPYFFLESDDRITVYENPTFRNRFRPVLYVACHVACVEIAKIATSSTQGENSSTRSMQQLWASLEAAWKVAIAEGVHMEPLTNLKNAGRYGWLAHLQDLIWGGDTDEPEYAAVIEADPMRISHVTQDLLSHLEPMKRTGVTITDKEDRSDTDGDPFTSIMHQLDWLREPPLDCTFSKPPSDWLSALLEHDEMLPWFWDLDKKALRDKEASKEGREWNWELWARQLCQPDISELGQVIENLPPSLRNRRRIWRLLDDMLPTSSQ